MAGEVREIELRRYGEIAKQRATYGIDVPAHIALEYAEFYEKYGPLELIDKPRLKPERRMELDLDIKFLIGQINSLTARQGSIERTSKRSQMFDYVQVGMITLLLVFVFGRFWGWF